MITNTTKQKRSTEELLAASRARTDALAAKVGRRRALEGNGPDGARARSYHRAVLACRAALKLTDDKALGGALTLVVTGLETNLAACAKAANKTAPLFPDEPQHE